MTDAISAISSVGGVDSIRVDYNPRNVDQNAFLDALGHGLEEYAAMPTFTEKMSAVDEVSGAYAGEVGGEKAELLSETSNDREKTAEETQDALMNRFTSLYTELTHYQIAWKIAQNVQRDINQVLKGS